MENVLEKIIFMLYGSLNLLKVSISHLWTLLNFEAKKNSQEYRYSSRKKILREILQLYE